MKNLNDFKNENNSGFKSNNEYNSNERDTHAYPQMYLQNQFRNKFWMSLRFNVSNQCAMTPSQQ